MNNSFAEKKAHLKQDQKSARKKHSSRKWLQKLINLPSHRKETLSRVRNIVQDCIKDLLRNVLNLKTLDLKIRKRKWRNVPSSREPIIRMCRFVYYMIGSVRTRRPTPNSFRDRIKMKV